MLGTAKNELLCPSALPDSPGSSVFGIVDNRGASRVIRYLDRPVPVSSRILDETQGEAPTDVFRFASPCQSKACGHFRDGQCSLPNFVQLHFDPIGTSQCPIRRDCRWFHQQGLDACARCPSVVTSALALVDGQIRQRPDDVLRK
jgi:hypothetical protein